MRSARSGWPSLTPASRLSLGILVAALSAEAFVPVDAQEPVVVCGQNITKTTVLQADLTCPPSISPALAITGSDIVLDLGGHTISGQSLGSTDTAAIAVFGVHDVTITNGTVQGFGDAIPVFGSDNVTLKNLTVKNLDVVDANHFVFGIHLDDSHGVVVEESRFEFRNVYHKMAVQAYRSEAVVRNIRSIGGTVGLGFWPSCDTATAPNVAQVFNSTLSDVAIAFEIECSNSMVIAGNTIANARLGVQADSPFDGAVSGLVVRDNVITTTASPAVGIEYRGAVNSTIANNFIAGHDAWGIALRQSLGCLEPTTPGWDCFYSHGNIVTANVAVGNGTDLFHDLQATPNVWTGNTCQTRAGSDISACLAPGPTTSAATGIAASSFTANWSSSSGATGYRLDVATTASFDNLVPGYQDLDAGTATARSVTGLSAGTTYYYRVRASSDAGTSGNSRPIAVTTLPTFTDDPLQPGVTSVKATHVTELRRAIGGLRTRNGLPGATWTDAILAAGATSVRAVHLSELRTALDQVYAAVGHPPPSYTDSPVIGGATVVRAAHIAELRAALLAIW